MTRNPFKKCPASIPPAIAEAVSSAYTALFEAGGSPQKKTRKMIRRVLPEPPGGWDSPAKHDDETDFVSRNGNVLTWDQVLETYIRGLLFHNSHIPEKFEPAAARIAFTELGEWPEDLYDFRTETPAKVPLGQFRSILNMLGGPAHVDEYNWDLNGLTYQEMLNRFGRDASDAEKDDTEDTGRLNYEVRLIGSFAESEKYQGYTPWCICSSKSYWNRYTARNTNTTYFLLKPGFEELSEEIRGDNYPHDEYSLSMIGLMIAPDGSVAYCCLRRNHAGGMGDHELSEKQISQLLGRPVRTVLPYVEPDVAADNTLDKLAARIKAGESVQEVYGMRGTQVLEGVTVYDIDGEGYAIVNDSTGLPLIDTLVTDYDRLDSRAFLASYPTGETDDYGDDITHQSLIRRDGRVYPLGGAGEDYGDTVFSRRIYNVTPLWDEEPGLYMVELDNPDMPDTAVIYLDDTGVEFITTMHEEITVYNKDHIILCDKEKLSWDNWGERGEVEIVRVDPGGKAVKLLCSDNDYEPRDVLEYAFALPAGEVRILYDSGADDPETELYLVKGGEKIHLMHDIGEYGYIDDLEGTVYVESSEGDYSVFSMKTCNFILEHLPGRPDREGIYRTEDGRKNAVVGTHLLLRRPAKDLEYIGILETRLPIGSRMAQGHHYFYKVTGDDGKVAFLDKATGEPLYGRTLPSGAYPYSDDIVLIEDADKDEVNKFALFTLDGKRRCEWFAKFGLDGAIIEKIDGEDRLYNLVDQATGKTLLDEWSPIRIEPMTTWKNEEGTKLNRLIKVGRGDGKCTIMVSTRDILPDDNMSPPSFSDTGIGWHRFIEPLATYSNAYAFIIQDLPGSDAQASEDADGKPHLLSRLYVMSTGKSTRQVPHTVMQAALTKALSKVLGTDFNTKPVDHYRNTYVSLLLSKCEERGTCWIDLVDRFLDEEIDK